MANQKNRFRQSRTAMLIDLALLPILIPLSIIKDGIPEVCKEIIRFPKRF